MTDPLAKAKDIMLGKPTGGPYGVTAAVGPDGSIAYWRPSPSRVERLCEVMHDAYEDAASEEGWSTQAASRKPWADVPDTNKATMRRAVTALLAELDVTDIHPDRRG